MIPNTQILVVAPTIQRSGESKSLTFSRPLRISKSQNFNNIPAYSIDGTPADCVVVGKHLSNKLFDAEPDLVLSGINSGDNTSVHALLTSGTCAVAFEGALLGIPSIAFSLVVKSSELFFGGEVSSNYSNAAKKAAEITQIIINNPLPEGIRFLNVNFPADVNENSKLKVVTLARKKYSNDIIEAKDPRGTTVFWIWGDIIPNIPENSDSHAVMHGIIAVTPISLGFGRWALPVLQKYFNDKNLA